MHRGLIARSAVIGLGLAAALAVPCHVSSQTRMTAGVRGKVVDEKGLGVGEVKIDMEFLGESRQKVTKTQNTDKKGQFVRMGLPDGNWRFTFTREGYKTYVMEMPLSLGGFSEAPDIVLQAATVAAPASTEPVAAVLPAAPESNKAGEVYGKAIEAAQAGRYDEAETMLKEVLVQFPDLAPAHYNLGYVYQRKRDWKSAEAAYRRVTELEPTKSDSFIALAVVRVEDNRGSEATEGLISASPAFEQDGKFQYALGITASNAGNAAAAEAAFTKAAALDPGNPEPLFHLATLAVGQNRSAVAVGLLEKYLGMTGQVPANLATAKALLTALKKK